MTGEFVRASRLFDVESRTPIAHPATQATDRDVRKAIETTERELVTDGGTDRPTCYNPLCDEPVLEPENPEVRESYCSWECCVEAREGRADRDGGDRR
ncbi:hypothetical protein [Halovivax cerinus]|uniref:Uncharacterized protein n=1 Tax=Halovivax cerinus TaxID=1487865 RepID=A0ABD5NJJ9_9EURY|nr:hypothetical protein [Halovivax cerinus]